MKTSEIEEFQYKIKCIRDEFYEKSDEFAKDNLGYSRNRGIIVEKLQEAIMWLANLTVYDKYLKVLDKSKNAC